MATTISGPTVTDDTGTPASPNNDGTLIDSSLFSSLYAAINTMWAGATQVFDGVLSVTGFGTHQIASGAAGENILRIQNSSSGTGNQASLEVGNDVDADLGRLAGYSSTRSESGAIKQNGVGLRAIGAGGLSLSAEDAAGDIRFYAGGTTENHSIDDTGVFNFQDGVRLNNIISPSLTAEVDDWAPSGLAAANVIRIGSDGAYNISGLTAQEDGRLILLVNVSGSTLTLENEEGTSSAANRFLCPGAADLNLSTQDATTILYDGTSSRWRVIDLPNAT